MRPKPKATPTQLRRAGYMIAALAAFVVVYSIRTELDYARFAETAIRTDARIVKIDAIREGKRLRHVLHYEIEHEGKVYPFTDRAGRETKLEELYSGTFNAFTGDDPPLQVGRTIGLLVSPRDVNDHRPDRAKLSLPSALWLAPLLGVLFMSGIAGFLFHAAREPKKAGSSAPPPPRKLASEVSTSRDGALLRVRAKVDVPWPSARELEPAGGAELKERLRALKSDGGAPAAASEARCTRIELRVELCPDADLQLHEARVDFLGASGEHATEVLKRALALSAGVGTSFEAALDVPRAAITARLVLVRQDQSAWQHDIAL